MSNPNVLSGVSEQSIDTQNWANSMKNDSEMNTPINDSYEKPELDQLMGQVIDNLKRSMDALNPLPEIVEIGQMMAFLNQIEDQRDQSQLEQSDQSDNSKSPEEESLKDALANDLKRMKDLQDPNIWLPRLALELNKQVRIFHQVQAARNTESLLKKDISTSDSGEI